MSDAARQLCESRDPGLRPLRACPEPVEGSPRPQRSLCGQDYALIVARCIQRGKSKNRRQREVAEPGAQGAGRQNLPRQRLLELGHVVSAQGGPQQPPQTFRLGQLEQLLLQLAIRRECGIEPDGERLQNRLD